MTIQEQFGIIDKAIQIDSTFMYAYRGRYNAKSEIEDYLGAKRDSIKAEYWGYHDTNMKTIRDYNNILKNNPFDTIALNFRAEIKYHLEDFTGAIEDYNNVIQLDSNKADAYFNRGSLKSELEDYTNAIADYNRALQINPNLAIGYAKRGVDKANLKDYLNAIRDYDRALQINPNLYWIYQYRGLAFKKIGQNKKADIDFQKLKEIEHPAKKDKWNIIAIRYFLFLLLSILFLKLLANIFPHFFQKAKFKM